MDSHHIIYKVQFKNVINIFSHGSCDKKINNIKSTLTIYNKNKYVFLIFVLNIIYMKLEKTTSIFLFDLAYQS